MMMVEDMVDVVVAEIEEVEVEVHVGEDIHLVPHHAEGVDEVDLVLDHKVAHVVLKENQLLLEDQQVVRNLDPQSVTIAQNHDLDPDPDQTIAIDQNRDLHQVNVIVPDLTPMTKIKCFHY